MTHPNNGDTPLSNENGDLSPEVRKLMDDNFGILLWKDDDTQGITPEHLRDMGNIHDGDTQVDELEVILVTALREAFAYAYDKGQQHDQAPDHLKAEAIKRRAQAAIRQHIDKVVEAAKRSEAAWWYRNRTNPDFEKAGMFEHRYKQLKGES